MAALYANDCSINDDDGISRTTTSARELYMGGGHELYRWYRGKKIQESPLCPVHILRM